jgi:hypothetical protein
MRRAPHTQALCKSDTSEAKFAVKKKTYRIPTVKTALIAIFLPVDNVVCHMKVKDKVEDTRRDHDRVRVYASSVLEDIPDLGTGRAGENFGEDTGKVESDDDANVDYAGVVEPTMYRARQGKHMDPIEHDRHFKQHHSQTVENNADVHPLIWLGPSQYIEGFLLAKKQGCP